MLNVTDPRFSATYGNHLLRQVHRLLGIYMKQKYILFYCLLQTNTGPRGMQYTTFLPGPVPPQVPMPTTSYASPGLASLPLSSRNQVSRLAFLVSTNEFITVRKGGVGNSVLNHLS